MSDRFYQEQKLYKPKRKLKADYIRDLNDILSSNITGLDKLTIKTLDELITAIENKKVEENE